MIKRGREKWKTLEKEIEEATKEIEEELRKTGTE